MRVTLGTGTAHLDLSGLSVTELDATTGSGVVAADVSSASSLTQLALGLAWTTRPWTFPAVVSATLTSNLKGWSAS